MRTAKPTVPAGREVSCEPHWHCCFRPDPPLPLAPWPAGGRAMVVSRPAGEGRMALGLPALAVAPAGPGPAAAAMVAGAASLTPGRVRGLTGPAIQTQSPWCRTLVALRRAVLAGDQASWSALIARQSP